MFLKEREEPHFHIWRAGEEYRFRLMDFQQLSSDHQPAPAGLAREVYEWAVRKSEALQAAFQAMLKGDVPDKTLFRD